MTEKSIARATARSPKRKSMDRLKEVTETSGAILEMVEDLAAEGPYIAILSALLFRLSTSPDPIPLWESLKVLVDKALPAVMLEGNQCGSA